MVVRRLRDFRQPELAVKRLARDALRPRPRFLVGDDVGNAVAREGELAGEMAVRILIHDATDIARVVAREHAVHHHLRDRDLAAHRLGARLEIDRVGETLLRLGALRP